MVCLHAVSLTFFLSSDGSGKPQDGSAQRVPAAESVPPVWAVPRLQCRPQHGPSGYGPVGTAAAWHESGETPVYTCVCLWLSVCLLWSSCVYQLRHWFNDGRHHPCAPSLRRLRCPPRPLCPPWAAQWGSLAQCPGRRARVLGHHLWAPCCRVVCPVVVPPPA